MLMLSILLLAICGLSDIKERSVNLKVLTAILLSAVVLMVISIYFRNTMGGILLYEPGGVNIFINLIPGALMLIAGKISNEAIGYGDGYVVLVLGFIIGIKNLIPILVLAFVLSGVTGLIFMMFLKKDKHYTLPFVPFLSVSFAVFFIFNY